MLDIETDTYICTASTANHSTLDVSGIARDVAAKNDNDKLVLSVDNKVCGVCKHCSRPSRSIDRSNNTKALTHFHKINTQQIFGKDPAPGKKKQLAVTFQDAPNGPLKQLVFDEGTTAEVVPGVDAPAPAAPVAVAVGGGENKQAVAAVPTGGSAAVRACLCVGRRP